jgi:hypothetical protein
MFCGRRDECGGPFMSGGEQKGFAMNSMIQQLENRTFFSISHDTTVVKIPGPTDLVVTTATNPAGHQAVGQNSTQLLSNHDAKQFK